MRAGTNPGGDGEGGQPGEEGTEARRKEDGGWVGSSGADQPLQMGQGGYLDVETGTVLAVQTGRDGRQGHDAGEAGLGQVQLLGQAEWRVHLAGGGGEGGSHGRALEDRLVSRAPDETLLCPLPEARETVGPEPHALPCQGRGPRPLGEPSPH